MVEYLLQNGAYAYDDDEAHGDDRENLDTKRNSKSAGANVNGSDENGIPDASNGGIKLVAHNNNQTANGNKRLRTENDKED